MTCSCILLAASLVVEKGRLALLALLGVVNVAVVAIFLYHICKQLWLWVGAPASKAVGTAYKNSKGWWEDRVSSQLRPKLQALRGKWPPSWWRGGGPPSDGDGGSSSAAAGWRSAVDSLWQKVQAWGRRIGRRQKKEQPQQEEGEQQLQRQANGHASPQANGHAPPAQRHANGRSDPKQARSDQQAPAIDQQQRAQQQANGIVPHLQADRSTGPVLQQQQQQANGSVQQLQGDSSAPPAVQQQQPAVPQHTIHQIPVTGRRFS